MRLFLDTSVLLAGCASPTGASREVMRLASANGWLLVTTPYVIGEVERNLPDFTQDASNKWQRVRPRLLLMADVLSVDRAAVFPVSKDRPVLFSALAWADVLLTLDRRDFSALLGKSFYGLGICKPGDFLQDQRASGKLRQC